MRKNNGQFAKGSTGNPNGRPKRADEQFLIDLWAEHGQTAFSKAIKDNERWALKVLIDKLYPNIKPVDTFSSNSNIKTIEIVKFDSVFTEEHEERLLSLIEA